MRTPSSNLRMAVAKRASSFRKQHFQPGSEAAGVESEGLQKLRQLCSQLGQDDGSCVAELLEVRETATGLCVCADALASVCMPHLTALLHAGSQGGCASVSAACITCTV